MLGKGIMFGSMIINTALGVLANWERIVEVAEKVVEAKHKRDARYLAEAERFCFGPPIDQNFIERTVAEFRRSL